MDIEVSFEKTGGPEVLQVRETTVGLPGDGEVRIRHHAIGLNFVDIYHRSGLYSLPLLPAIPGVEGAGVIEDVGSDVDGFCPGDRIAYAGLPVGAYSSRRILPAWRAISLPGDVPFDIAAASMLRGLTVHMLLTRVFNGQFVKTILVHAAAGGLGQYATRWAKRTGMIVIGTVGSANKAEIAKAAGADHVIIGRDADFAKQARDLTGGAGVDAIIDGVGGKRFLRNFDAVNVFGAVASVGQPAGMPPAVEPQALNARASSFSRPSVIAYINDRSTYLTASREVLAMMAAGVHANIGGRFALKDAATAHQEMEAGRSTGSLILIP